MRGVYMGVIMVLDYMFAGLRKMCSRLVSKLCHCLFRICLGLAWGWTKGFVGIQGVYVNLLLSSTIIIHICGCAAKLRLFKDAYIFDKHRNNAEKGNWKMQI